MEVDGIDLDGIVSDDDYELEEEVNGPWFSMGMMKEEKIEARKPWHLSLLIKLVEQSIGYQFLPRRLQAIWRSQQEFSLIDLCNDFFIVCFSSKQDYEMALFSGPLVISNLFLHVQR